MNTYTREQGLARYLKKLSKYEILDISIFTSRYKVQCTFDIFKRLKIFYTAFKIQDTFYQIIIISAEMDKMIKKKKLHHTILRSITYSTKYKMYIN